MKGIATSFLLWLLADPTFLHRRFSEVPPVEIAEGATYKAAFGEGDPQARQLKGVARYGESTLAPGATVTRTAPLAEEHILFVLEGSLTLRFASSEAPLRRMDFAYIPPGTALTLTTKSDPARFLLMSFRIPKWAKPGSDKVQWANALEVPAQTLPSHGPTTTFRLLMGTTESRRDRIAATSQMTSLFLMEFAPGGTNIPHHHETEEEIYYILKGRGEMVAGGGAEGNEGRYPTQAGDAWFLRLNTTVGFYSGSTDPNQKDLVLAVRSKFPFPQSQ